MGEVVPVLAMKAYQAL